LPDPLLVRTFRQVRPLDRSSPLPLWAQLLDDLRARLDSGEFTEAFPTDLELTTEYGVSRHTAREAVRRLQAEGVVSRERGRGTFVRSPTFEQPTGALYSLFRSIEARGLEQRSEVLDRSLVVDPAVAERLELEPGAELVRLQRLRLADGRPLALDTVWLPASVAAPLLDTDLTHTALYDELQRSCGVRPVAGTEWIATALPTDEERQLLHLPAKQPVFRIQRRSDDASGRHIEWREAAVRGDRYTFVAQWSPDGAYAAELRAAD
jgi:GntR family transcriptional regulator